MARPGSENPLAFAEIDGHRAGLERLRRVRQLDRTHDFEATYCPLELRTLVGLISRRVSKLFFRIGLSFCQILWRRQKAFVLRRLPNHDVVMRDDRHIPRDQHLIATRMIEVIVTVDCVLDWEFRERLNFSY